MWINNLFFKLRDVIEVSPAKRDRLIFASLVIGLFANVIGWILIPLFFWQAKEFVVLQYNIYFGISSLGSWPILWLIPFSGLVIMVINYALAFYLYLKEKIFSQFLAVFALAYQLIALAALALIIYMNI